MRTITKYFSMILIAGILLASTGCYVMRDHDRHGQRYDRNDRGERDDRRDRDNRGERDDPRNRDDRGDRDHRR